MNTREDPDFGEIPEYIADRLAGADARFKEWKGERNPLTGLPELASSTIFGTKFYAYDARGRGIVTPGAEGAEPVPIVALYAAQSRFLGLCDLAARRWVPELADLVAHLEAFESASLRAALPDSADAQPQGQAAYKDAAHARRAEPPVTGDEDSTELLASVGVVLESYGIEVARDCYIIGYRDSRSPLVVRKELILELLQLLAQAFDRLEMPEAAEIIGRLAGPVFEQAVLAAGKID